MSKKVQIKQKIKSIQATKKITHAIRLVSMSLYAKLEHQEPFVRHYVDTLSKLFYELANNSTNWPVANPNLFSQDKKAQIFIIISTTKGLCGSLNSNLFRYIKKEVPEATLKAAKFITVGQKSFNFVADQLDGEILCSYNEFNTNNFLPIASDIVTKIDKNSSVFLYFNKSKSFFSQYPTIVKLLPLSQENIIFPQDGISVKNLPEDLTWEQSEKEILDFMFIRFIKGQITKVLAQALVAEYASRFLAMDNSTNNAEKYLEKLTLQYNKIRQGAITREVSELCASFMDMR